VKKRGEGSPKTSEHKNEPTTQQDGNSNSSEEGVLEFTRKLQNYPVVGRGSQGAMNFVQSSRAVSGGSVWRKLVQSAPAVRERAHTATGKMVVPQLTIEQPSPPAGYVLCVSHACLHVRVP
jgi:hypothetical protein